MKVSTQSRHLSKGTAEEIDGQLRPVIGGLASGIVMCNGEGTIVYVNGEFERMSRYEPGALLGQPLDVLVPARLEKAFKLQRQAYLERKQGHRLCGVDASVLRMDGSEFQVALDVNPIDVQGTPWVIISVADMTERRKVQEDFARIRDEAQRRSREIEQFVYTVSHDLKSPLVTSMSFLAFLKEDLAEGNFTAVHEAIQCLERAHSRMQELIENLMELSRIGHLELQLQPIQTQDFIHSVVQTLAENLRTKHLSIEVSDRLPIIVADPIRFQQIVENLISNALKYGVAGPDPRLKIFSQETDAEILLCFKDNGPGIPAEYHSKVFELFHRLGTDAEGTGVGLTIVSRAMQLHGGKVWIESSVGQGTEFWLAFPKRSDRLD